MKYIKLLLLTLVLTSGIQQSMVMAEETCYSYGGSSTIIRSVGGSIEQWRGNHWVITAISCTFAQRQMFGDGFCAPYDGVMQKSRPTQCPDQVLQPPDNSKQQ